MEKIRPLQVLICRPRTYNDTAVDNYQTEYTKQIYDKNLIHIMLCFQGNFNDPRSGGLNWYIKNTGYVALKDFINIELSTLYFPSSMPLHICLFFAKKNGLKVVSSNKKLIIPLTSNSKGSKDYPFTINLFLQPDADDKFSDEKFWKENTYLLPLGSEVNEKLPFTINILLPTNVSIIKYMILLCPNDEESCNLLNYMSIKYPKVNISIKDKLTCYFVKCSYGITIEFLDEIFRKIINFRRARIGDKNRFLIYFINSL